MITIIRLERWVLLLVLMSTLLPLTARTNLVGVPLYALPMAILFMLWAFRTLNGPTLDLRVGRSTVPFMLVIVLMGASTIVAEDANLPNYTAWAAALGLLVYANQNWNRTFDLGLLLIFAAAAAFVEIAVAFAQIATQTYVGNILAYFGEKGDIVEDARFIAGGRLFRPVGTVGLTNMLGTFLIMMSALLYPVASGRIAAGWTFRIYSIGVLVASLGIVIVSGNRGNVLVALSVPFIYAFLQAVQSGTWAALLQRVVLAICAAIAFLGLVGWVLYLLPDFLGAGPILQGILTRIERIPDSFALRAYQFREAAAAASHFPILGMGFDASSRVWEAFHVQVPDRFEWRPHNVYLIVALEAGLLAGIAYVITIATALFRYLHRAKELTSDVHAVFVPFLVFAGLSLIYVTPFTRTLWPIGCFLLGALQASCLRSRADSLNGRVG